MVGERSGGLRGGNEGRWVGMGGSREERDGKMFFFFFQAEDGIRDIGVTGVQTCALPISYALLA